MTPYLEGLLYDAGTVRIRQLEAEVARLQTALESAKREFWNGRRWITVQMACDSAANVHRLPYQTVIWRIQQGGKSVAAALATPANIKRTSKDDK